jgi:hypothetical protein
MLHLMESVIPTQRWGVTRGPWGTMCNAPDYANPVPGVTVALKNSGIRLDLGVQRRVPVPGTPRAPPGEGLPREGIRVNLLPAELYMTHNLPHE